VILDDHLQKVAVALEFDLLGDVVPDLLGAGHALHQLQVANLLGDDVLIGRELQSGDCLAQGTDLLTCATGLLRILWKFALLQNENLALLAFDLQDVQSILLLDLHEGTAQLDSLVEVLENFLLDAAHLIDLLTAAAGALRAFGDRSLLNIVAPEVHFR
jgi:hypothetical protein